MAQRIAIFWPGDYRAKPNEWARPSVTQATQQLEAALNKLGRRSYRVEGFLTRPHEAIEKLGPIDDPLIGVCVHWFYGPHTCDGVVGKSNPLLLASNFSGQWPGLVGLLNTAACLASVGRDFSRIWTDAADWTADAAFMARLDEWCRTGRTEYPTDEIGTPSGGEGPIRARSASEGAHCLAQGAETLARASGSERAGSERAGSERAGSERAGSERAGSERAGSERAIRARSASEGAHCLAQGAETLARASGSERAGSERAGSERAIRARSASEGAHYLAQAAETLARASGSERAGSERAGSELAARIAQQVLADIRRRRILALMLGDTSMGMINGYFGPRLLNPIGFTEHKVDQAWLLDRGRRVDARRIDDAFRFVRERGVTFHWRGEGCPASIAADAADFTEDATREQLRDYLAVLDLINEFKADCLGWQYQLGLLPLRPPSDFAEGLFNSACRPESSGEPLICSTEADQGNLVPMELMKRLLKAKGLHAAVMFHDVRWGGSHDGRFVWVLLNSGSCGAYALNHEPDTLRGVHSYRQPSGYFPIPGGTFAGESLPGGITWARAWMTKRHEGGGQLAAPSAVVTTELWMDIGRGEVLRLPPATRDAWWEGTTRQWPFMAADLGVDRNTLMAHYMSNHIAVAYGDIFGELAALSQMLGFNVRVWGA